MLSVSFQQFIFGVFLNCIAIYMVKYIDDIIQRIIENSALNKILVTINVLMIIAICLLIANINIF